MNKLPEGMTEKAKAGRPSDYSPDVADMICEAIASGGALYRLCEQDGWPAEGTVYRWLEKEQEFREKYARARERQADRRSDEIIHIADEAEDANLARLRVDARKWAASKLAPKKYGDKVTAKHVGDDEDGPIRHEVESPLVESILSSIGVLKEKAKA